MPVAVSSQGRTDHTRTREGRQAQCIMVPMSLTTGTDKTLGSMLGPHATKAQVAAQTLQICMAPAAARPEDINLVPGGFDILSVRGPYLIFQSFLLVYLSFKLIYCF